MFEDFELDLSLLRTAASSEERRRVFRGLALRYHPDKQWHQLSEDRPASRPFQELLEAYRDCSRQDVEDWQQDETDQQKLCSIGFRDVVHGVAFGLDGETMLACGDPGCFRIWRRRQRHIAGWTAARLVGEIRLHDTVLALGMLDDSRILIAAGAHVELWSLCNLYEPEFQDEMLARVFSVATSAEACRFAAGSCDGDVRIWSTLTDSVQDEACLQHPPEGSRSCAKCMDFAHLGHTLIVGGGSQMSLWRFDGFEWEAWTTLEVNPGLEVIYCLDVSDSVFAVGGLGGLVSMHRLPRCSHAADAICLDSIIDEPQLFRHSSREDVAVNAVSLSRGGIRLASAASDCSIILWHCPSQCIIARFEHSLPKDKFCCLNTATLNAVQFSPDDSALVAGGYDCHVTVWRLPIALSINASAEKFFRDECSFLPSVCVGAG